VSWTMARSYARRRRSRAGCVESLRCEEMGVSEAKGLIIRYTVVSDGVEGWGVLSETLETRVVV
jgi:hypothetical protein